VFPEAKHLLFQSFITEEKSLNGKDTSNTSPFATMSPFGPNYSTILFEGGPRREQHKFFFVQ
jgi:hypothetical protein